jgi:general secretion pathway protein G
MGELDWKGGIGRMGKFGRKASACGHAEPRTRESEAKHQRQFALRVGPQRHWISLSARCGGYTFVELLVVATIIMILASAIMPLAKVTARRQREVELHRVLREVRTAIDHYKDAADNGLIGSLDLKVGSENYPPDLQTLVDGVTAANDATGRKLKFLRRIPVDPMTHKSEWGLRSYQDKPDSMHWGGQNVFDVYTTFDGTALDGSKYRDW